MTSESIQLIVGLGNPGQQYEETRHNAGEWFVNRIARAYQATLRPDKKFHGAYAKIQVNQQDLHLLFPTTFMNLSGIAVSALCQFYKIKPESVLVAHDELDLPPGVARLKKGGGHGGHNGLKDIISKFGNNNGFYRLRIGIDHPGHKERVHGHVLGKPSQQDLNLIEDSIDSAFEVLPELLSGDISRAMQTLHSTK
jgi:PTH1 family peptidyl-tRNA hydrolase